MTQIQKKSTLLSLFIPVRRPNPKASTFVGKKLNEATINCYWHNLGFTTPLEESKHWLQCRPQAMKFTCPQMNFQRSHDFTFTDAKFTLQDSSPENSESSPVLRRRLKDVEQAKYLAVSGIGRASMRRQNRRAKWTYMRGVGCRRENDLMFRVTHMVTVLNGNLSWRNSPLQPMRADTGRGRGGVKREKWRSTGPAAGNHMQHNNCNMAANPAQTTA